MGKNADSNEGWHLIRDYAVYVEDGVIAKTIILNPDGTYKPAKLYKRSTPYAAGKWHEANTITVPAFRNAVQRGTIMVY